MPLSGLLDLKVFIMTITHASLRYLSVESFPCVYPEHSSIIETWQRARIGVSAWMAASDRDVL